MTSYISMVKDAMLLPFDYWNTAASSGKLFCKTIDVVTADGKLAGALAADYFPNCPYVKAYAQTATAISKYMEGPNAMWKAFTDGSEPLRALLDKGSTWYNGARNFTGAWYKNEDMYHLVAQVALVAGLSLAIPVYLGTIGAYALPVALMAPLGATSYNLAVINLARFSLLAVGSTYRFYEGWSKTRDKDRTVTRLQQADASETTVKRAKYDALKTRLGFYDDATKIAGYAVTVFSLYISPIQATVVALTLTAVNKRLGAAKDYCDVKFRDLPPPPPSVVARAPVALMVA